MSAKLRNPNASSWTLGSDPIQPYDIVSQQEVLGCALADPGLLRTELSRLTVSDFAGSSHQTIFGIMLKLAADNESFGILEVAEAWRGQEGLEKRDEACAYLAAMLDGTVYTPSLLARRVERLQKLAQTRRIRSFCQAGLKQTEQPNADPAALMELITTGIAFLREGYDLDGNLLPYAPRSLARRPDIVKLSLVESKPVPWLWQPYLISGMLNMISGDPGVGKTYVALAIAAAVTVGRTPYTGDPCLPMDVLYFYSPENPSEYVLKPRFDLLEGNADRFHILMGSVVGDGAKPQRDTISLSDIPMIQEAVKKTEARLVIIDPIQSYLGAEVDMHRSNETRPILDGLARMAGEHNCCMLILRHMAKSMTGHAVHRGLGSIDLTGAARSELHAGEINGQKALVHAKSNMGEMGKSLGFEIRQQDGFRWTGQVSVTASDLAMPELGTEERTSLEEAVESLREMLANGPRLRTEILKEMEAAGISEATVKRAKAKLKAKHRHQDGKDSPYEWYL